MSQTPSSAPSDAAAQPTFIDSKRRGLLQGAAVAVATGAGGASAVAQAASGEPTAPSAGPAPASGYRLTEHVREYYAKARF